MLPRRHFLTLFATCAGTSPFWRATQAEASEVYTGLLSRTGAGGHDVVAYFREGRPVEGTSRFTHPWKGATWRFASAENRDAFAADPEKFAPAYGGHCAWAAAQGYKAKGDPQHWRIVNGRLFLNYDAEVQQRWEQDIPGFISAADATWALTSTK